MKKNNKSLILFDESHNESGRLSSTYVSLKELLEQHNYECRSLNKFPISFNDLKDAKIFVISSPDLSKFRDSEVDSIVQFVKLGGGLLIMSDAGGDPGHMTNLNVISTKFGIKFNNDQVMDSSLNCGIPTIPQITIFPTSHPVVEGVTKICYRAGCSLSLFDKAIPLALSNKISQPPSKPVIGACEFGAGSVIAIGTYELFRDIGLGGIENPQHRKLALNIMRWLETPKRQDFVKPVIEIDTVEELPSETVPPSGAPSVQELRKEALEVTQRTAASFMKSLSEVLKKLIEANRSLIKLVKDHNNDVSKKFNQILESIKNAENIEKTLANLNKKIEKYTHTLSTLTEGNRQIQEELSKFEKNLANVPKFEDLTVMKRKITIIHNKLSKIEKILSKLSTEDSDV
ncbi:MAG: hypothetical protein ACTSSJ_00365 [Candidatus Odinarchaeia archaeon]